jgi:hypothetical protein
MWNKGSKLASASRKSRVRELAGFVVPTQPLWLSRLRAGFVAAHPWHKNKYVPWMGHPTFVDELTEGGVCGSPPMAQKQERAMDGAPNLLG